MCVQSSAFKLSVIVSILTSYFAGGIPSGILKGTLIVICGSELTLTLDTLYLFENTEDSIVILKDKIPLHSLGDQFRVYVISSPPFTFISLGLIEMFRLLISFTV